MVRLLAHLVLIIMARVLGNVLILGIAAIFACFAYFVLLAVVDAALMSVTGQLFKCCALYRGSKENFWFLIALGYVIALPPLLLVYFPVSMWLWKKQCKAQWFVVSSALIATSYAAIPIILFRLDSERYFMPLVDIEWLALTSFCGTGSFTGLFHRALLVEWRDRQMRKQYYITEIMRELGRKIESL